MARTPRWRRTTSTTSLSGALHAIGTADTPVPPLNILGDYGGGGMLLAVGLLSGILECRQSGVGQVLDVSMLDGAVTLMAVFYGMLAQGTWRARRQANVVDGAAHFSRSGRAGAEVLRGALRPPRCFRAARGRRSGRMGYPRRSDGGPLPRQDASRVGAGAGGPPILRSAGAQHDRGARASPEPGAGHVRGGRRRGPARSGAPVLPHGAAAARAPGAGGRPDACRAGPAGAGQPDGERAVRCRCGAAT